VTKLEVITEIANKTGINKDDVTTTVEAFFSVVKNSMSDGQIFMFEDSSVLRIKEEPGK